MKGKSFLKVAGILMIIFGALALVLNIFALVGVAAAALLGMDIGVTVLGIIISLVSAAIELITGIIGVKYCADSSKAKTCMVWGIIVAALCVLGHIITAIGGGDFGVFGMLCGLVIPIIYIIGAKKNMATPAEEAPVEEAPAEEAPAEEAPAEEAPVEEAPVEEAPAEETPAEE